MSEKWLLLPSDKLELVLVPLSKFIGLTIAYVEDYYRLEFTFSNVDLSRYNQHTQLQCGCAIAEKDLKYFMKMLNTFMESPQGGIFEVSTDNYFKALRECKESERTAKCGFHGEGWCADCVNTNEIQPDLEESE